MARARMVGMAWVISARRHGTPRIDMDIGWPGSSYAGLG